MAREGPVQPYPAENHLFSFATSNRPLCFNALLPFDCEIDCNKKMNRVSGIVLIRSGLLVDVRSDT